MKTVLMCEASQGRRGAWQLAIRLVWGQRLRSATAAASGGALGDTPGRDGLPAPRERTLRM